VPKTYNTFTNVSTGDVLTATNFNNVLTNIAGYRVPPMCRVRRSGTASAAITPSTGATGFLDWNTEDVDTESDDMWVSGSSTRITVRTAGLYLVQTSFVLDFTGTSSVQQSALLHTTSGGTDTRIAAVYYAYSQPSVLVHTLTATYSAAVGDYFRVRIETISGASSITLRADTTCFFSATWLGQVS
jgi:hypothetical protein